MDDNVTSVNSATESPTIPGTNLSLMQLYFLIVLVLAVLNGILGLIYGCIQHKDSLHNQICFTEYRQSGDETVQRAKRPVSANLVLNAGTKKMQIRQVPSTY